MTDRDLLGVIATVMIVVGGVFMVAGFFVATIAHNMKP